MTVPTLTVEIGRPTGWLLGDAVESILGTTTKLGTYAYEPVTGAVRSLSIHRGRNHELDRVEAGVASVTFMNQDGTFNPTNTASSLYPDVRPMVPIRILAELWTSPLDTVGLVAWYDFTDISTLFQDTARTTPITADAQVIKGVTDKSGNGNHLTEATNGPTYKENIINGGPVGRFDGTNDKLTVDPLSSSLVQPYTVFFAGKFVDATTANDPMMDGKTGTRSHPVMVGSGLVWASYYGTVVVLTASGANTNTHVFCATANGASSALRVDGGASILSGNPGTQTLTCLTLANNQAAGGSAFAQIDFSHLLLYSGNLPNEDKNLIGTYLAADEGTTWTLVS